MYSETLASAGLWLCEKKLALPGVLAMRCVGLCARGGWLLSVSVYAYVGDKMLSGAERR